MAASGYKLFVTGDVLTAAQVNDYLMLQTVMVFASSAARTTALSGVLAEGLTSYLKDTNSFEIYDGSGWVSYGSGDITAVSAGTGISVASGTGPVPVVTNSMATEITAKGDLIAGTGSATFDNLPVGTNGQILVADSSTATGLKWATAAGGGKVLQVVQATNSTASTVATTTLTDQGISATITPTLNTSKVLVLVSTTNQFYRLVNIMGFKLALLRGATSIWTADNAAYGQFAGSTSVATHMSPISYLDSPATTSATTYKVQIAANYTTSSGQVFCNENGTSTMILLEIGA